jgi:ABC-type Fe3+/spermidine/putrescine transport system ATPase subunit
MQLEVRGVSKGYPGLPVLDDITLSAATGEILCLLGPSGCGKTTLLRLIAGLEQPDRGTLAFAGQDLAGVPVHERNFGLMFQDYALFPHRTVDENVAFGLRMQGLPASAVANGVTNALELVQLPEYGPRRVQLLSGGEQQRVALARSLAPQPRLMMLDEPLGALDRSLREQLIGELRRILRRVGVTTVYVTHDQGEAFALADRIAVMQPGEHGGRLAQMGSAIELYRRPQSRFVAHFLGFKNLIPARVLADANSDFAFVQCQLGTLRVGRGTRLAGEHATLLIRPEAATVATENGENVIEVLVSDLSFRGSHYLLEVAHASGVNLSLEVRGIPDTTTPGATLCLALAPDALSVL